MFIQSFATRLFASLMHPLLVMRKSQNHGDNWPLASMDFGCLMIRSQRHIIQV